MRVTGARGRAALALAVAIGVVALVAGPAAPADNATSATVVPVALSEWKLEPGKATVRGGRVSFVVRNDGTMAHEFLVLRSERHHHMLKVKGGKAVEAGRLGRIPRIAVGESKRLTLKVTPGKYVLLCNMLGHYQAGQYASLRVR